jgi:hypothetical protein
MCRSWSAPSQPLRADRHVVGDAEGEVQVGEAVAAVHGERAHGSSGNDALVLLREPKQTLAESIPLLNGEHEARVYFRADELAALDVRLRRAFQPATRGKP